MVADDNLDRPHADVDEFDAAGETPSSEDRNLATLAHLSALAGLIGAGLLGFVGPLVIYLWKNDSSPFVGAQAKEALNFQLTLLLLSVGLGLAAAVSCGLLLPLLLIPVVLQVIFAIIAALTVRDGQPYRYPFNIRFLR